MRARRRLRVAAACPGLLRLLAAACLLAALAAGGRAAAHAQLVAAEPAAGAIVAEMPPEIALRFNEPVAPLLVRWLAPGSAPAEVAARVHGPTLLVPAPAGLGNGTHVVSWRVVSTDGHPIAGSHVFSVGAPTAAGAAAVVAEPARATAVPTAVPAAVARGLLTLSLVIGVGGAVFLRLVARGEQELRAAAGLAWAGALLVPLAALAALGLHGLDMLAVPPAALASTGPWIAALRSPVSLTAGLAALAGLLAVLALRRRGSVPALVAGACAALSFALSGHAATASPVWLTAPAVAAHAAAFLFWLGALPGIAVLCREGAPGLAPLLRRFSNLATPLVALLVVSGAALAVVQLGGIAPRLDTGYGRILALKLAAVAALLALAALNRLRLTPAIAAGALGAPERLRRSVLAEIVIGLVILALAAGFRLTPPPRAIEAAASEIFLHLHGSRVMAEVTLRPGHAGANAAEVVVTDAEFRAITPRAVRLAFSDPDRGIERIVVEARPESDVWRADPVHLPVAGDWTLRIEVLVSDFEQAAMEGELTLPE